VIGSTVGYPSDILASC